MGKPGLKSRDQPKAGLGVAGAAGKREAAARLLLRQASSCGEQDVGSRKSWEGALQGAERQRQGWFEGFQNTALMWRQLSKARGLRSKQRGLLQPPSW